MTWAGCSWWSLKMGENETNEYFESFQLKEGMCAMMTSLHEAIHVTRCEKSKEQGRKANILVERIRFVHQLFVLVRHYYCCCCCFQLQFCAVLLSSETKSHQMRCLRRIGGKTGSQSVCYEEDDVLLKNFVADVLFCLLRMPCPTMHGSSPAWLAPFSALPRSKRTVSLQPMMGSWKRRTTKKKDRP